ncbi:MAG: MerR family transcriptional regulator [Desulfovibrionaceae bacterium]|nr:MerR family transcriptional regulator [Desulfovibrionaceae bacterium]
MLRTEEFLLATGISREKFDDLLSLEWVETETDDENNLLFSDTDIYRVRKMMRICEDFELPLIGGTIIVDLLERIRLLEETVQEIKGTQRIQ